MTNTMSRHFTMVELCMLVCIPCAPRAQLTTLEVFPPSSEPTTIMFAAHRKCTLNRDENRDFQALRANQINVSCECHRRGHEWSSRFGLCVDVNECIRGTHNCTRNVSESCLNLPGDYTCICRLGYVYNPEMKQCVHSPDIDKALKGYMEKPKAAKERNLFAKIVRTITRSAGNGYVRGCEINFPLILTVSMYGVI